MSGTRLKVNQCILEGNVATTLGGGIHATADSQLQVSNCLIQDNSATSSGSTCGGGGIAIGSNTDALIEDSEFLRNYGMCRGGGINVASFVNSSAEIVNSHFEGNYSGGPGHASAGEMLILSSTFERNGRESDPDWEAVRGGGSSSQIQDSTIRNNYCGGVADFQNGVVRCFILDNSGDGVAISAPISDSLIAGNERGISGSTIVRDSLVQDNDFVGIQGSGEILRCVISGNGNGGIVTTDTTVVENCLVYGNSGGEGGGISVGADGSIIRYCTIVNNQAD
ncbi:MAG: right-handed parallel beta-helix repeat-containing protein, partial [Candidatus Omnitrophica bacterium]|nr:right-handed parallel beta-helix repeat-containing protein [Candidatus Omnitrophota bacterium]